MNTTAPDSTINCKNCDTTFVGNFCPNCGQSVKDYEKPFGLLLYDLMGNIFAFDTRLWKTLKAVLFQPGKMASEFIAGHRVRYMPPFRLYVFISFIFFLLLNTVTLNTIENNYKQSGDAIVKLANNNRKNFILFNSKDIEIAQEDTLVSKNPEIEEADKEDKEVLDHFKDINSHPEYYLPQFFKYLSWFLFLLMPLYGAMLWLFFRKSYEYYLGHLIFAINQHSFLFIIFIIMMLLSYFLPGVASAINGWLFLLIPIYSIIGAHKLYKKKWLTVFGRLLAIFFMYSITIITGLVLAAVIVFV